MTNRGPRCGAALGENSASSTQWAIWNITASVKPTHHEHAR